MGRLSTQLEWVRPPLQARSQESLDRILDAAEEVVAEKGFEQATVAEIVRRAKSSVGAFYARFREKDALLGCLHDRFRDEAIATTDAVLDPERWRGASIAEILRETIPLLVEAYRDRRGLMRAFIRRASVDPVFAEKCVPVSRHLCERLSALILARSDEINHADPHLATEFSLQIIINTLDALSIYDQGLFGGIPLDDSRLGDELTRVVVSYLGVEESGA